MHLSSRVSIILERLLSQGILTQILCVTDMVFNLNIFCAMITLNFQFEIPNSSCSFTIKL